MYKLSIGAIAKNEHFGLEEWVNYHRVVGVEHFYIYDNDSQIPVRQTLAKYINAGLVTVIEFPGLSRQMPSYTHCLQNFGGGSEWIAFIDCDEFLLPKQCDSVPEVLQQYHAFGGHQVNWILFGTSGHVTRPEGLVIENYTLASKPEWPDNLHTKAIVQPRYTLSAGSNPHYFHFKNGFHSVDEEFQIVSNAFSNKHCNKYLQINHYTTKSLEEFQAKISKGRADAAHLPTAKLENLYKLDMACTDKHIEIQRFVERLEALQIV
jgi:hypothetical protein